MLADKINKIEISGNNKISDETILVYGEVDKNTVFTEKELNKVLRKLYETELFENVNVRIDNSILKINVSEYQSISSLKFNGENPKDF